MKFSLLLSVLLGWPMAGLAKPIVSKAFEHPDGFLVFELAETRGHDGKRSSWYFGKADGHQFIRLIPSDPTHFSSESTVKVYIQFVATMKDGAQIDLGQLNGVVSRDPDDATAPYVGELNVSCEGYADLCFTSKQKRADELSDLLDRDALVLDEPPHKFRKADAIYFDPGRGDYYVVDLEVLATTDFSLHMRRAMANSIEVWQVNTLQQTKTSLAIAKSRILPGPWVGGEPFNPRRMQVWFRNGQNLDIDLRPGKQRMLLSDGPQTRDLKPVDVTLALLEKLGLANHFRASYLNPCQIIQRKIK